MVNPRIAQLIQCLVFFIPVNVYVLGNWMGCGIQWSLFRYQVSYLGESLISFSTEMGYVYFGIIQGKSGLAIIIWAIGVFLLLGCFLVNLLAIRFLPSYYVKKTFLIIILSGVFFLLSDLIQYGLTFQNPAGICIPVGIPFIFFIGYWGYRNTSDSGSAAKPERRNIFIDEDNKKYFHIPWISKNFKISNDLLYLIALSIIIKYLLFFISLYAPYDAVTGDITLYYHYVSLIFTGRIPYVDFAVEYPPFFFIPALTAFIPQVVFPGLASYLFSFMVLMYALDIAMLCLIYNTALVLFGKARAFTCGLLYATAVSAAFFIPLTYDLVPTFLLFLSFFLYLHKEKFFAYICVFSGTLMKWYPVFASPYYILHTYKCRESLREALRASAIAITLFLISTVPFLLMKMQVFLITYTYHFTRDVQTHSFVYYLQTIFGNFIDRGTVVQACLILLIWLEIGFLYYYLRYSDTNMISLMYFIFLSVFVFILLNKVFSASYIIWITPFLALLLAHTIHEIVLFYLIEIIVYIETPLLYRIVYGDGRQYFVLENSIPSFPFIFYSVKFLIYFAVLWVIVNNIKNKQNCGTNI